MLAAYEHKLFLLKISTLYLVVIDTRVCLCTKSLISLDKYILVTGHLRCKTRLAAKEV